MTDTDRDDENKTGEVSTISPCVFQDIYRHAYQFLGCLLYLTHEFPLPKDIFSGSVFSAFYMVLQNQGQ